MESEAVCRQCDELLDEIAGAVVTERSTLETILVGILADRHVLLKDVPGTGKTLTARSFANTLGVSFSRVQFAPDLLPSDVVDEATREFEFRPGPVFANVMLADKINRAPPKTQAALLEAMEEGQVTVNGEVHSLPDPFVVIATQNRTITGDRFLDHVVAVSRLLSPVTVRVSSRLLGLAYSVAIGDLLFDGGRVSTLDRWSRRGLKVMSSRFTRRRPTTRSRFSQRVSSEAISTQNERLSATPPQASRHGSTPVD